MHPVISSKKIARIPFQGCPSVKKENEILVFQGVGRRITF
jgi:hypothetical protein